MGNKVSEDDEIRKGMRNTKNIFSLSSFLVLMCGVHMYACIYVGTGMNSRDSLVCLHTLTGITGVCHQVKLFTWGMGI